MGWTIYTCASDGDNHYLNIVGKRNTGTCTISPMVVTTTYLLTILVHVSLLGGSVATGDERKQYMSLVPLQRFGTRREIAESALFLASPLSSYMTGSVMVVDGGEWLMGQVGGTAMIKSML